MISITVSASDSVLSITTCGSTVKAEAAPSASAGGDHVGQAHLALQQLLDGRGDASGAALFVLAMVELALELDGVERHAVARGRDLRIDDVGAGRGAGAGHHAPAGAGWFGREQR